MAAMVTPGLTPLQRQQVADVLRRVGHVPLGQIASLFVDLDTAAARVLNVSRPSHDNCESVAQDAARQHQMEPIITSFAFGLAVGLRQGRAFAPAPPPRAKHWISEEYRQLYEENRRTAAKFIRTLLKAQGAPRQPGASSPTRASQQATKESELAAAQRWARETGRAARKLR